MTIPDIHAPQPAVPGLPDRLVWLFAVASGLCVANVYYAQPLLDALARDLALSQGLVGIVVTATQAGSVLALLLVVPLGDLHDRRRLAVAQLLLLCGALAVVATAQTAAMLLAGMLATGLLGTAMTQSLIAGAASLAEPAARGRVVGTVQGGVVVGLLLARVVAGCIADWAGWRAVYCGSSAVMLVLAAVLWRALPRQAPAPQTLLYLSALRSMAMLLRTERVLQVRGVLAMLMFAAFSIFWSAVALPLSAPPYLFSHTAIGALGLAGALAALAAGRAGRWADRGWAEKTTAGALLLLVASWVGLSLMPHSGWALIAGVIALDLAGQAIHVTNQSLILRLDPNASSRLIGCYMLFYALGSGLGAIAATTVYAAAGWSGVCLLGATVSATGLAFWWWTLDRPHQPAPVTCQDRPQRA